MKKLGVIIIIFFSIYAFGQDAGNRNRFVPVSFVDITRPPLCQRLGGWCPGELSIVSPIEPRDPDLYYGRFYIDENDSLKLSLEKELLPIRKILVLFEDNLFKVDSTLNIPWEVARELGLYSYQSKIQAGDYRVYDSEDMKEIIINFGKPDVKKEDNNDPSDQPEIISPLKKETDEQD